MTLSEEQASQLKAGDPLEFYVNREWVPVTVVEVQADDTVRVSHGQQKINAEWGELRPL